MGVQVLDSLAEVAGRYDAIVLDQWGVLHDGSAPFDGAVGCLITLAASGTRLAVLSNSGKRAAPNSVRISNLGFDAALFEQVMTSGEALYQTFAANSQTAKRVYAIERAPGDAASWADGLGMQIASTINDAEAVLLMGLPDNADPETYQEDMATARARNLAVYCSNPDVTSPRAGGELVVSPGALAHAYAQAGGEVHWYGKPHLPVFRALEKSLSARPDRLLMVGDSLHHDIAGGAEAGWDTVLICNGIHAQALSGRSPAEAVPALAEHEAVPCPTYSLASLR